MAFFLLGALVCLIGMGLVWLAIAAARAGSDDRRPDRVVGLSMWGLAVLLGLSGVYLLIIGFVVMGIEPS